MEHFSFAGERHDAKRNGPPEGSERSRIVDAVSKEETARSLAEMRKKAERGLSTVYERLNQGERKKREEILMLIAQADGLDAAPPHFQARLAREIANRRLEKKIEPEFIEEGVKILMVWLHGQAMAQSADAALERLQGGGEKSAE